MAPSANVRYVQRLEEGTAPFEPGPVTVGGYRGGLPAAEAKPPSPIPSATMAKETTQGTVPASKPPMTDPPPGRAARSRTTRRTK
jgi:hypothetical protein